MLQNRKVVFTSKGNVELQVESFDETKIPAGHVVLKNHYSLISTGTELACLNGYEGWFQMPAVPGYISVGEVVAKADDVSCCEIGDVIYNFGGHQEYAVMPTTGCFMKVPSEIEEKYVPLIRTATIAMAAIRTSDIVFGDYVAVTGQGLVGIMTAQLAHLQGARAIGIDHHDNRLKLAKQCQVDYTINSSDCDMKEEISRLTNGEMIDTFVEAIGNTKVLVEGTDCLAKNGEMIILGTPRTTYVTDCSPIFNKVFQGSSNIRFKGAHEWKDPYEPDEFVKHSIISNTKDVIDYMVNGRLVYKPLLTHVVRPEQCAEIYADMQVNKDKYMGVVFDWTK